MAAIFGPRTKYSCEIWSLGQFLGRTIFAMTGPGKSVQMFLVFTIIFAVY